MLRNDKIIHRMNLRQKLQVILSKNIFTNSEVSDYAFPTLRLLRDHKKNDDVEVATQFPSNYALALTWNDELIRDTSRAMYEENRAYATDKSYLFDMSNGVNNFSSDHFLTYKVVSSLIDGINSVDGYSFLYSNLEEENDVARKELEYLSYDLILDNSDVKNVIVSSLEELEFYKNQKKFKGRIFAKASSLKDIIKYLLNDVMFIYYCGDEEKYESILDSLEVAVKRYDYSMKQLNDHVIDENMMVRLQKDGEILSREKVELACDNVIDLYIAYDKYVKEENVNTFSLKEHAALAKDCANEAIVMLKNENNILPLKLKTTVGLIGDSFINKEFYDDIYEQAPTEFVTPFDEVQNYTEIKYLGYAHGYLKGKPKSYELIEKAVDLASHVNVTVCYLWNENNEKYLPESQLALVDALSKVTQNLVCIVHSACVIDLSFIDKVASVLLVNNVGQGEVKALLDILCGKVSPSGHLLHPYPLNVLDKHVENGLPDYLDKNVCFRYPFGYGLSYGEFEYSYLEVSEAGVKFTIKNISGYDAYALPQLYISKEGSSSTLSSFILKGFRKFFIPKGECMKITIPFDSYTFRYYNENKKCYGVEGGEYIIHINTDSETNVLEGKIKLSKYLDEKYGFKNEVKERAFNSQDYIESFLNSNQEEKERGLSFAQLIATTVSIFVIFTTVLVLCMVQSPESARIPILIILLCIDIPTIAIFIKTLLKREKKDYIVANENLTAMLKDVKEAEVLSFERFEKVEESEVDEELFSLPEVVETEEVVEEAAPEEEEVVEEITEEEDNSNEVSEESEFSEEEIRAMEEEELRLMEEQMASRGIGEKEDEEDEVIVYDNESSLYQVCFNFIALAKSKGLYIELSSVRSVFSQLASSKILFVNTKIKELLPEFLACLNEFLGDKGVEYSADSNWISSFNLQWVKDSFGNYVNSPFVNSIIKANRLKDNLNIAILNNVDMNNFNSYFKDYIEYANSPKLGKKISLSKNTVLTLPENLMFIICPKDDLFLNQIDFDLAVPSGYIELLMRKEENIEELEEGIDVLSKSYFEELLHDSKKTSYFSEDNWKKIDAFIKDINEYGHITLPNKVVLSYERYAAMYIGAGGDEVDALDSLISEKIIPLVKSCPFAKEASSQDTLIELVRKNFGEENTARAVRTITSFQVNKE